MKVSHIHIYGAIHFIIFIAIVADVFDTQGNKRRDRCDLIS